MTSISGKTTPNMPVVIKRAIAKSAESAGTGPGHSVRQGVRIEERCCAFITGMVDTWMSPLLSRVAEFYKKWWDVENTCRSYGQMRPWPTGTDYVRALL